MSDFHVAMVIAMASLVTMGLRFLPFLIFGENRSMPLVLEQMGQALPYAIMGMLVVYCLKDVRLDAAPFGIPEAIGCLVVALLHAWKRNTLLSIGSGTVCYMLLVQFVC